MIDWSHALARAEAHSPFLSRAMARLPDLVAILQAGDADGALAYARRAGDGAPDLGAALRREKLATALALGIGDLAGAFPLLKVTGELSALADRALDQAITHAILTRAPDAPTFDGKPKGFALLALGKQGAQELNYSSDVDPILIYDPETLPRRARDEPEEAALYVARQILKLVSSVDGEGYVFRVDLRLRPASEISPLAIPLEAALTHYESSALAWERAAFIRARAAAGDVAMGEGFLHAIRPFVWRKSLDFGAIAEIGRLTRRIRAHHGKVERIGPGFDVKRGRGGIREVEFFAQVYQLIHGGRNPALRLKGTRATLDALATAGLIDEGDAVILGESYDRLRQIEHRLQQVSDLQTHNLPKDMAAIDNVARLDGLPDAAALIAELEEITGKVGDKYDKLIDASGGGSTQVAVSSGEALEAELAGLGFAEPATLAARIDGWRSGTVRCLRSEAALGALDAIQPALLAAFARAPEPDKALTRWERLITRLSSAVNLFRLLEARPALLQAMVRVLSLAQPLAEALALRADLLDALIDTSALDLPPSVEALAADFGEAEAGDDYQRLLDRVRRKVGEKRFALGVQLIEGAQDPLDVSAGLCRVAEAAIDVLARATLAEFEATHGRIAGGELVILGLGRLGGGMLTHASDLDIVYLFTGGFAAESDGRRPLGASVYFNRLAQRISAALSVPTAEGALYEVDTRLRPQGTQGPLAVSFESFRKYQCEEAWTWEHMALVRARVLFGSEAAREELGAIIGEVLRREREPAKLTAEVLEMRDRMAEHKHPKGTLDVKLLRGGLVDGEFTAHCLQLREGVALRPDMAGALEELAAAGLIPADVPEGFALLSRVLVASRLLAPDATEPDGPAPKATLAKACGFGSWVELVAAMDQARSAIARGWEGVFGQTLETDA